MRFGARILFEDVTTTFLQGRRYAITGPNGSGKSTFMKILTGEIEPEKGSVTRPKKIGILRQDQFAFDAYRVLDTVIMGNAPLWDALQEREKFYANPNEWTDEDGMRLGELEGIVGDQGGYTAEADAATLLQGLDIDEALHERKMSELQGGQKVRVLLAQALFSNADVLLLDEPTNNLDLDSVHWLQRYLLAYTGCLIVISHDRHFLNEVCTHTADIDYQSIITYTGAYDDMVLAKTQIRARVEAGNAQREKKIAQLNEFIAQVLGRHQVRRKSRRARKKWSGCRPRSSRNRTSSVPISGFKTSVHPGRHPLEIKGLSKSYGDLAGDSRISRASIARGEKIALLGRNGAGKTTMLRSLLRNATGFVDAPEREFPIDSGVVTWGHEVAVGYFSQDHKESIQPGATLLEWLHEFDPTASQQELRGLLGQMLFSGEDATKRTENLSGGEAARLIFCRLMLQKPNFLLLDEPTNHLDLESINALNIALQKYDGTVLLVTHDHDLVDEVATRIWHFEHREIEDFKGPYAEYLAEKEATTA